MAANIIRKRTSILSVLFMVAISFATTYGASAADIESKPGGTSPLDRRHEQVGNWACGGTKVDYTGAVSPYHAVLNNKWSLDRQWLVIHFEEQRSDGGTPFIEDQYWGYSAAYNKHTRTVMANDGGYGMVSSNGWEQDVLDWQGTYTLGDITYDYSETIERQSKDRYRWAGVVEQNDTLIVGFDVLCNRK